MRSHESDSNQRIFFIQATVAGGDAARLGRYDQCMTGVTGTRELATTSAAEAEQHHQVRVLVYSDDRRTREQVMLAVGSRPARDVEVIAWKECATAEAVQLEADAGGYDLFILDGEAVPLGGMGLCRQLKFEIFDCPPVVVLTGRPQDAWLAAWSYAERAVPHPLDPLVLAKAVAHVVREGAAGDATTS